MLEIKKNSRQIPKVKEICGDKKYYDMLYAHLQCVSIFSGQGEERIVEKSEINFKQLGEKLGISRQTASVKFKNLISLGLLEELDNGDYKLVILEKNIASLIPQETLQFILDVLNENSISTYVYLLNRYVANRCQPYQFTMDQVKTHLGISTKTRSNNHIITNILMGLEKLELLKYEVVKIEGSKTIYKISWITNVLKFCTGS